MSVCMFSCLFVCFLCLGSDLEPRCAPKSVGYMFHSRTDNPSLDHSTDVRETRRRRRGRAVI